MAKYAPSALLGRISRSAGGTTFGHNRYGAYFRNRVIPTNPVTPAQAFQRANFGTLASTYRSLTSAERLAWEAFGQNYALTDTLGETYNLTGFGAYMSVNRNIAVYGGTAVTTPPIYTLPASIATITITAVGA